MARGEQLSAVKLAGRDTKKTASKVQSDTDSSFDSDVAAAAAVETRKKKERELKSKVTAAEEETEALERQLADAEARKKLNWVSSLPFAIRTR